MNRNPARKQFWRLCGPILLYWLIEFVVNVIGEAIVMAPHMGPLMQEALKLNGATQEELMEFSNQFMQQMYAVIQTYQVQILAVAAFCTIPLTWFLFHSDRKREKELQIPVNKKAGAGRYVEIIGLGAAVSIGMTCLSVMTNLAFASTQYQETSEMFYSAGFPVQILCLGLIMPLTEELMFRGVLYKRYREQSGYFRAALFSTLLFCMTHGNIVQMIYTAILGMMLAYVYEKFGSFKAPVLLHMVVNMTSLLVTNAGGFTWLTKSASRMGIAAIACAFTGSAMFVLIQRIQEKPEMAEPSDKQTDSMDMFR